MMALLLKIEKIEKNNDVVMRILLAIGTIAYKDAELISMLKNGNIDYGNTTTEKIKQILSELKDINKCL